MRRFRGHILSSAKLIDLKISHVQYSNKSFEVNNYNIAVTLATVSGVVTHTTNSVYFPWYSTVYHSQCINK